MTVARIMHNLGWSVDLQPALQRFAKADSK